MDRTSKPNRRMRTAAMVAACCVLVASCGTRLSHEEHLAAAGGGTSAGGSATGTGRTGATGGTGSGGTSGTGATGGTGSAGGTGSTGGTGDTGGDEGTIGGADDPGSTPTGGSPIRIGMIGNFGGIAGASFVPAREMLKAWVATVNARGGINGHAVELLIGDDGNEGARDLAIAKDFVENQGVIAIVNYFGAAGGPPTVAQYAQEMGVPVIGGLTSDLTWANSPYLFPQTTGYMNTYYASAAAMRDEGMNKIAIVYCSEGAVCRENADAFRAEAEALGLEVVYSAGVSLAQPDFTAECLAARGNGANAVYPQLDGNSVARMARSCGRQDFYPRFFLPAPVDPPDASIEGAIGVIPTFPWMITSGSPALDEYGQALAQYAADVPRNNFITFGWMTGKVLELAAAHVSEPPTSQDILNGLWAMNGETFGGLSPALTFVRDQPAPPANCGFLVTVQDGQWVAPRGMELVGCR